MRSVGSPPRCENTTAATFSGILLKPVLERVRMARIWAGGGGGGGGREKVKSRSF